MSGGDILYAAVKKDLAANEAWDLEEATCLSGFRFSLRWKETVAILTHFPPAPPSPSPSPLPTAIITIFPFLDTLR